MYPSVLVILKQPFFEISINRFVNFELFLKPFALLHFKQRSLIVFCVNQ